MRRLFFVAGLLLCVAGSATANRLVTQPQEPLELATCRGASPCKACTSCSSCKHCKKEGGTCGVCKK